MEQYGLVIETGGETAMVTLQQHLACGSCGRCGMLSGSTGRDQVVEVLNPIRAQNGQRVILETDDRQILFISFMLYLVPLAALLAGIIAGLNLAGRLALGLNHELFAAGVGLAGMVVVFVLLRLWDNRVKGQDKYKPVITGIIDENSF